MSANASMNLHTPPASQRGLGLIELMVSLLLGLLVAGSAIAIFSSNRQAYNATESLGRIQENARIAYELMARDLHEAGGTTCQDTMPIANVVTGGVANGAWWSTWGGGVVGYPNGGTGTAPAAMLAGTNAIQVIEGDDNPVSVVSHNPATGTIQVNSNTPGLKANDLAIVCDYRQSSMFEVSAVNATGQITYGTGGTSMNCSTDLSWSLSSPCASGSGIQYANGAMVSRLRVVQWYVGNNGRGGTSLYQAQVENNGTVTQQEIAEGVTNMTLTYLVNTAPPPDYAPAADYVPATSVGNWSGVIAVRVVLAMQGGEGQERVSTTNGALTRNLVHVIALRNHAK